MLEQNKLELDRAQHTEVLLEDDMDCVQYESLSYLNLIA